MGIQASLESFSAAKSAAFNFPILIEGVVVGINYPGDTSDTRYYQVTYDVQPISSTGVSTIYNAVFLRGFAGYDDGDESILRVSSKAVGGEAFIADSPGNNTDMAGTDGDRVVVGFLNGNFQLPLILGVIPHAFSKLAVFKDADGKDLPKDDALFRRIVHRGTEFLVDPDGNVSINLAQHPEDRNIADKKDLTIKLADMEVVVDNSSSPTSFQIRNSNGGGIILKVTNDTVEMKVTGDVNIKSFGKTNIEAASVNLKVDPGGKINLGGDAAQFTVAMLGDTAGPYPLVCSGMTVMAAK